MQSLVDLLRVACNMMAKECPEGELVAPKAVSWERGREGERGSREREGGRKGGREREREGGRKERRRKIHVHVLFYFYSKLKLCSSFHKYLIFSWK